MTGSEASPSFRLAYVPGVTPTKWVRIWNERLPGIPLTLVQVASADAQSLLRERGADAGFVRLPVDGTDLSAIPLYTEQTVVVIPKDHVVAAVEELSLDELADEIVLHPLDDTLVWEQLPGRPAIERPATTADAIELVAAGVGVLAVPQSLARLHHRKDLTYRPLSDAPESRIALSWPEEATTDLVEDFIGIVRGRTVNSTRGRGTTSATRPEAKAKRADGGARKSAGGAAGRGARAGSGGAKGAKGARGAKGAGSKSAGAKRGKPRRRP
ncbi:LysR family substrate-binding domain-containing protein [Streptomyces sp. ITFR-16]|uniref:LysR family substrate-binding domain-containing protein n=1 Tax=Streptomyces sp. ITFR-16 TaxID=3075198 RepID=UPI00288A7C5B|nr:LysR family substrate-binding domain-containing protein [Streptomyces sp. ITFR-16]WNI25773.1 LysR family substrate-binding domain-containing protein [Streptomyces sp. ITFR-16]